MTKKTLDVFSPFDQSLIKTIKPNSPEEVELMLQRAYSIYNNKDNWLTIDRRIAILKKINTLMCEEKDNFSQLIAKEGGKPLSDAKIEVERAINGINISIREIPNILSNKEISMMDAPDAKLRTAFTIYEPIGVVVAVSAFNHPLNLIIHQIIPAIAVGCPVIVKPATATPLNCLKLVDMVYKAGLPKEWCQVCVCPDNKLTEKLVTDKRISFFSFIGSSKVGWWLKSKLAPGVRCALEHGGVAPVIVDKDINIEYLTSSLLKGGFYHAGQVCVSVQRIFIDKNIINELSNSLVNSTRNIKIGDPTKIETEVGPLILPKEVDRIDGWVKEAIEEGAELLIGGEKLSDTVYKPTILLNPSPHSKVSTSEIFGPVICLYSYSDIDEAIKQANCLDVAFQASVYSNNTNIIDRVSDKINASTVIINDHTAFRIDSMPFAGRKHSGYGIGGIGYTMHDMVQHKMIVKKDISR